MTGSVGPSGPRRLTNAALSGLAPSAAGRPRRLGPSVASHSWGEDLVVEQQGPISIARLNRPEARNALTPTLITELGAALVRAENDPGVRAVVLTGTGDKAFCAGMDLRAFASGDATLSAGEETAAFYRFLSGETTVPLIGAANGSALAGGLELLLGCDLIVIAEGASMGLPEVKRGLFPGGNGTFLSTRIPLSIALELLLTGDSMTAARGAELGLANAVVPAEQVLPVALDYAERIAANGPLGVAAAKELARRAVTDADGAKARLRELQPQVFASADAKEGALAFVEKRDPVWQGR